MDFMKRNVALAIIVLTLAVASAGCGEDTPVRGLEAGPAPSVPPSTSAPTSTVASATPTVPATSTTVAKVVATPTTAAPSLSSSSRLRIDGIGPITVGMTVAEARAAAGTELSLRKDPYCDGLTAPRGPSGVALIVTSPPTGRIDLIIVNEPTVATISGIRVGSTEAEVKAAYPGRIRTVNPSAPVRRLVYEATDPALADRVLVFVIDGSRVATMYAGVRNQVEADEICG
jgi:hypothetical protein